MLVDKVQETATLVVLQEALLEHCKQCKSLVGQYPNLILCDSGVEGSSAVGAHLRHIRDRIDCFLNGFATGLIDFDARLRDKRMETVAEASIAAFQLIEERLSMLTLQENMVIKVRETIQMDGLPVVVASTLARELLGLALHCIHHQAIIQVIAQSNDVALQADFGKAPSTIAYEMAD